MNGSQRPRRALIAGGGIGGLGAALALARRGWEVRIFEQAGALDEIGAGIQISPNGVRVLEALGVMHRLAPAVFEPEAIEMRMGRSGRRIFRLAMSDAARARWGASYLQIHRADLVDALAAELSLIAPSALCLGARATGYGPGPVLHLEDGTAAEADLVIGADGLHSAIRAQMLGPDRPRFTGMMAWRAIVPAEAVATPPPPVGCIWAGAGRHAVTTYIRAGSVINFVGIVERTDFQSEGWSATGTAAEALADFEGYRPEVRETIRAAGTLHRWALFDRAPLARWTDGAVALLGDAAHPMLPSMAQGAVQALEDGWVLAAHLDTMPLPEALLAYGAARLGRTSRIQRVSASNARLFHHTGPGAFLRYAPAWLAGHVAPWVLHRRTDWIYGWRPEAPDA